MTGPKFCIVEINGVKMRGAQLYREYTKDALNMTWECIDTLTIALTHNFLYTQFDDENDATWHVWCWNTSPHDEPIWWNRNRVSEFIDIYFALGYDDCKERIAAYLTYPDLPSVLKYLSLAPNNKEPL